MSQKKYNTHEPQHMLFSNEYSTSDESLHSRSDAENLIG